MHKIPKHKAPQVVPDEWELLYVVIGDREPNYWVGDWVRDEYHAKYPVLEAMTHETPSGWRTRASAYYRSNLPAALGARFENIKDSEVVYVIGLINREAGSRDGVLIYADYDYKIELWPDASMKASSRCDSLKFPPNYASGVRAAINSGVLAVGARVGSKVSP